MNTDNGINGDTNNTGRKSLSSVFYRALSHACNSAQTTVALPLREALHRATGFNRIKQAMKDVGHWPPFESGSLHLHYEMHGADSPFRDQCRSRGEYCARFNATQELRGIEFKRIDTAMTGFLTGLFAALAASYIVSPVIPAAAAVSMLPGGVLSSLAFLRMHAACQSGRIRSSVHHDMQPPKPHPSAGKVTELDQFRKARAGEPQSPK